MAKIKAPFFVTVLDRARENCANFFKEIKKVFPNSEQEHNYYSVKTNMQPRLLADLSRTGIGAQVVSAREFALAKENGFLSSKILVDGIYHDEAMYDLLREHDNLLFVESWSQNIDLLNLSCKKWQHGARLGLRFKFPRKGNRLGFSLENSPEIEEVSTKIAASQWLKPVMIACHAGSQVQDPAAYITSCKLLLESFDMLEKRGISFEKPVMLNLGGGFPEPEMATPSFLNEVMNGIKDTILTNHHLSRFQPCFEPGRYIAGDTSALVATILNVFNDDAGGRWGLLNVGMDVITRFANSHYRFFSLEHPGAPHGTPVSFQGRVPTEQDVFGKGVHFIKEAKPREHVLILNCGAYSTTFSMRFSFDQPRCVFIDGKDFTIETTLLP